METAIEYYINTHTDQNPTVDLIEILVCKEFGITRQELRHRSRKGDIPTARFLCWYLIRKKKILTSFHAIKDHYNYLEHSSIIHGIKQVKGRMEFEKDLKRKYLNVLVKLG